MTPNVPPVPGRGDSAGNEPEAPGAVVAGLAREVDTLRRTMDPLLSLPARVDDLTRLLGDLTTAVAALTARRRRAVLAGAILLLALAVTLLLADQDVSHVWDGLLIPAVMFTGTTIYRAQHGQIPRRHAALTIVVVAAALLTNWFAELVSLHALIPRYMARSAITLAVIGGAFDSLLAKLIVWGETRDEALARARRALDEMVVEGMATALPLYHVLSPDTRFVAFALFIGVAMSVTAFPVLARIVSERRMRMVARLTHAEDIHPEAAKPLRRLVENVSIAAGLPVTPEVRIVDDAAPNAYAAGLRPTNSYVGVTTGLLATITAHQPRTFGPAVNPISTSLTGTFIAQLAIGALGVLLITGEYSTGMIRSSLTAVPRRLPMLWGKLAVFAAAVFVTMLAASVTAFLIGQALLSGHLPTATLSTAGALRSVIGAALYLTVAGITAVALGALLRNTAAAITTFVAVFFVIPPLTLLLPASLTDHFVQYLPSSIGGELVTGDSGVANSLAPWTGFGVMCGYAAVLIGSAAWRLHRVDA